MFGCKPMFYVCSPIAPSNFETTLTTLSFERVHYRGRAIVTKSVYDQDIEEMINFCYYLNMFTNFSVHCGTILKIFNNISEFIYLSTCHYLYLQ